MIGTKVVNDFRVCLIVSTYGRGKGFIQCKLIHCFSTLQVCCISFPLKGLISFLIFICSLSDFNIFPLSMHCSLNVWWKVTQFACNSSQWINHFFNFSHFSFNTIWNFFPFLFKLFFLKMFKGFLRVSLQYMPNFLKTRIPFSSPEVPFV